MKTVAAIAVALVASAGLFLTGCASDTPSASGPGGDDGTGDGGVDTGSPPPSGNDSGTPPPKDSGASTCVSPCTTDQQCQSSCAPVNNGVNCCDSTGVCYAWSAATCPPQTPDSGSSGGYP